MKVVTMITKDHSNDGFIFRKTTFPNKIGSWEVYWNNWVAIGTYKKDESWQEIKAMWPSEKQEIINDRLA